MNRSREHIQMTDVEVAKRTVYVLNHHSKHYRFFGYVNDLTSYPEYRSVRISTQAREMSDSERHEIGEKVRALIADDNAAFVLGSNSLPYLVSRLELENARTRGK